MQIKQTEGEKSFNIANSFYTYFAVHLWSKMIKTGQKILLIKEGKKCLKTKNRG